MISAPIRRPNQLIKESARVVFLLLTAWVMLTSVSSASTITGTVMNLSRRKPSSGDVIVMYRVDKSMHEIARAKSDARGAFQFEDLAASRHLVAVMHDGISYHTPLLTGSDPATVLVYDAVPRLAAVRESSSTLFPEVEGPWLKITQFFVVSNASAPARTLVKPFHFQLPSGAVLDSAAVQPPKTLPFLMSASACGVRDQYCIASPMRPGETRIRVIYHLDFHGGVSITLHFPHSVDQVTLKIPESLRLQENAHGIFRNEGQQNGISMYSADGLQGGQSISFTLSPVMQGASETIGESAATQRAPELHDAEISMRAWPRKAELPKPAPSPAGRSSLGLMVLIGAFVGVLLLKSAVSGRLLRYSARPGCNLSALSFSRKAR